jgi:predicted DNA-binding transcriptional regulator AlpA
MTSVALTIEEFSKLYSLNVATVRTNITRNPDALPRVMRIGKMIRFRLTDIKQWEEQQMAK